MRGIGQPLPAKRVVPRLTGAAIAVFTPPQPSTRPRKNFFHRPMCKKTKARTLPIRPDNDVETGDLQRGRTAFHAPPQV
jgi:hypothetical protein